jgi:hypothetical protein
MFAALLGMAGYMVLWAYNDAEAKAKADARLQQLGRDVGRLEAAIYAGQLPIARQRLDDLSRRVERLEKYGAP